MTFCGIRTVIESPAWRAAPVRATLAALVAICLLVPVSAADRAGNSLPPRLSDAEFWQLVVGMSEPNGSFQSDNLVGNERPLQQVVPLLESMARGGAYVGVAPDQNFTYIAALEPRIAFIVDIRRGNLLEHLMYKAILELSPTRADFVARLFSMPPLPEPPGTDASVAEIFREYGGVAGSPALFEENLRAITAVLVGRHGFPLSTEDLAAIRAIYAAFFEFGPAITYASTGGSSGGRTMPSYAELQQETDRNGRACGYLASETRYRTVRAFQERNLLVPIVGDFAGPKALRAVGTYLKAHGATVTAFYVSNVEQYLFRNAVAPAFYANVATLPLDRSSVFIRSTFGRNVMVVDPILDLLHAFDRGGLQGYMDVTARGTIR